MIFPHPLGSVLYEVSWKLDHFLNFRHRWVKDLYRVKILWLSSVDKLSVSRGKREYSNINRHGLYSIGAGYSTKFGQQKSVGR